MDARFYEFSFGLKSPAGRDPRSRKEPVEIGGGFRLKGSIDLVERHRGGMVRVVDHKTGRVPDPKPEMVGRRRRCLQPRCTRMAAEKLLDEQVSFGRLYYATIAQNYQVIDVPLNDWSRRRAMQVLEVIDARDARRLPSRRAAQGRLQAVRLPAGCGPYEEERVEEKSQAELKGLKELRGWR